MVGIKTINLEFRIKMENQVAGSGAEFFLFDNT